MILGLTPGKEYKTADERAELRYGKVMLMTDQDHDGTHHVFFCIVFELMSVNCRIAYQRFIREFYDSILAVIVGTGRVP